MTIVYRPTSKALRRKDLKSTDRFVFTGAHEAICFHADTLEIIEPFMIKSKDCYVEPADTELPRLILPYEVEKSYRPTDIDKIRSFL